MEVALLGRLGAAVVAYDVAAVGHMKGVRPSCCDSAVVVVVGGDLASVCWPHVGVCCCGTV